MHNYMLIRMLYIYIYIYIIEYRKIWASAHLHCHFRATIPNSHSDATHFLGLDKILPRGGYMEVLQLSRNKNGKLEYEGILWEDILKIGVDLKEKEDSRKVVIEGSIGKEEESKEITPILESNQISLYHDKEWLSNIYRMSY